VDRDNGEQQEQTDRQAQPGCDGHKILVAAQVGKKHVGGKGRRNSEGGPAASGPVRPVLLTQDNVGCSTVQGWQWSVRVDRREHRVRVEVTKHPMRLRTKTGTKSSQDSILPRVRKLIAMASNQHA
jgi:hypothetical protein